MNDSSIARDYYEFVETVQEIMPGGYVDKISDMIFDAFKRDKDKKEIVDILKNDIDIFFDAEIIVETLFVGLRNINVLKKILKANQGKGNIAGTYVVASVRNKNCCEFCRTRVDGKVFKLVAQAEEPHIIEEAGLGKIELMWPKKLFNATTRWVRADYQHLGSDFIFQAFDPFVQRINPQTREIEELSLEETNAASQAELDRMIELEKNRIEQELEFTHDPARVQILQNHLTELNDYMV